jgi:hypothetical protein
MYAIFEVRPDTIYIAFPRTAEGNRMPDNNVHQWIFENIPEPKWGFVNSETVGIFLSHEDAVAFRLVFGL